MKIIYQPGPYSQQRQFQKPANIYPVLMAMEAEAHRQRGDTVYWGLPDDITVKEYLSCEIYDKPEGLPFLSLPAPDREFTRAKEYTSGNYKHLPGTHIMSALGCSWGKCKFCVEQGKPYEVRSVESVIEEIKSCQRLGFREVFDDAATLQTGEWLEEFVKELKKIPISFSCNMRAVGLEWRKLRDSGFRMVLFGLESANQGTLDGINKGLDVNDIMHIMDAARAGIDCHVAVMFGYPWESDKDAQRTLRLVHFLLREGYAKTAQASLYMPPDGINNPKHAKYVHRIYNAAFHPKFWINYLKDIQSVDDIKYIGRGIKSWLQRK